MWLSFYQQRDKGDTDLEGGGLEREVATTIATALMKAGWNLSLQAVISTSDQSDEGKPILILTGAEIEGLWAG